MLHLNGKNGKGVLQCIQHDSEMAQPLTALLDNSTEPPGPHFPPQHRQHQPTTLKLYLNHHEFIHITNSYLYMGKQVNLRGNNTEEIKVRKAKAISAFNTYQAIITSPDITIHHRLHLLKTLSLTHLYQQHHSTLCPSDREIKQLKSTAVSQLASTKQYPCNDTPYHQTTF
eukprot:6149119-Amphidinium_carterae.1